LSFARAVPVALLLALAAPAVAQADATLSVSGTAPHKTLTLTVNDALNHAVDVTVVSGELVITDTAGIGSGCTAVTSTWVKCGQADGFERLAFAFGDGNDKLDVGSLFIPVTADGGAGDDLLEGGALADELIGGPDDDELHGGDGGDYLEGDGGTDTFDAGPGDDDVSAAESPEGADAEIACGAGDDVILDYDDADTIDDDCETTDPPYLDGDVRIIGDAQVGSKLGLSLPTNLGGDGNEMIQWERCNASGDDCTDIAGAQDLTYTLTAADLGLRLRAWYGVDDWLGDDWVESEPTAIVRAASDWSPTSPPPRPTIPRAPGPSVSVPNLIPALMTVHKPAFAMRAGRPVVDTGRTIACPGVTAGAPCGLKVTA